MEQNQDLRAYLSASLPEAVALLKELCLIPAPSGQEDARAAFVKKWLEDAGAKGVYVDEAKNVVFPMNCEGKRDITVFAAHTDTVFPMETPLSLKEEDGILSCPGVGDDTSCLVLMLMTVKYILSRGLCPENGVLFVANSCEEGLGNLKGARRLFDDYQGRIGRFYTFDGTYRFVVNRAVGSHRYRIVCKTEGGHSYGAFGNANAIAALSRLITDLYTITVPAKEGSKTTYNVGAVSGGTSVNTIAQNAEMLFEYRSNDADCLAIMKKTFEEKLEKARRAGYGEFEVEVVGLRPCQGNVDEARLSDMTNRVKEICREETGLDCVANAGSTDCNIPLSLGIPAVCAGSYDGGGMHTREEWLKLDSLPKGYAITARLILDYFA